MPYELKIELENIKKVIRDSNVISFSGHLCAGNDKIGIRVDNKIRVERTCNVPYPLSSLK